MTSATVNMRVVHLAPTAFGQQGLFGGGERYPLELARAMAQVDGVECELVTFGSVAYDGCDESGLHVRVLTPWRHLGDHPAHPFTLATVAAVRHADVIHCHHLRATPTRIAALTSKLGRQRIVVTDHGLAGGDWFGMLPRLVDGFLTVSQYSATELGAPPQKTRVIYGGADPGRFSPASDGPRNGIVFVGRITPHKGIDRLIEAVPDGATMTIAGSGGHDPDPPECDYERDLRKMSSGRDVRFVGAVADDELPGLYRSAAVAALPSVAVTCYGKVHAISELLGLGAIEAMSCATPVVASRIGGLAEVVADGETGYLVEPGDVDELHRRLASLLADPALARRMGNAARQRVLERFTWEACAHRCLRAYRELLG